jgi:poly(A) polymerase
VLSEQEELAKIRPDLDGNEIMRILGVPPGRVVGQAYRHLLDLRMEHGPLGAERATQELLRWAAEERAAREEAAGEGSAAEGEAAGGPAGDEGPDPGGSPAD